MSSIDPQAVLPHAAAPDAAVPPTVAGLAGDAAFPLPGVQAAASILVADADVSLGKFLCRELQRRSYAVQVRHAADEIARDLLTGAYDVLLLDLSLPDADGMALLRQIRLSHPRLPIMVMTARARTEDLVSALEQGADDCIFKPISFMELQARLKSLLRRCALLPAAPPPPVSANATRVGNLALNRDEHWVQRGERRIDLTAREFALLDFLMNNAGKAVSRATLMREVWNTEYDASTNIVDVYMKYLRDKIDLEGEARLIRTVRGVGYVLSQE